MNHRKSNRITWYSLVLLLVLCAGFLVLSTGTSFARYRSQRDTDITFQVQPLEQICLGTPGKYGRFIPEYPTLQMVDGVNRMDLAVANGTSADVYAYHDQKFTLQFWGSPGLWDGDSPAKISLLQEDGTLIPAKVTRIAEGTTLYHAYGDGWIYRFFTAEQEKRRIPYE